MDPYSKKVELENQLKELTDAMGLVQNNEIKEAGEEICKLLSMVNEKAIELLDPLIKEEEADEIERQILDCLEIVEQFRLSIISYIGE